MSFPLIQNPSPLGQLQQVLQGINTRNEERRLAAEDSKRRGAYLTLNQEEARRAQDEFAYRQQRDAQTDKEQAGAAALEQAQFNEIVRTNRITQMTQAQAAKREVMRMVMQALPPNVSASIGRIQQEAAGNRYLPGVGRPRPTIADDAAAAQSRSVTGLSGSAFRVARPGTVSGVTYSPETVQYNQPAGAGGRGTTQDRLMQAAIGGALQQVQILEDLERRNPMNATIPALTATIEGAGNLPLVGGTLRGALGPTSQRAMSPEQQAYQASAGEFIHTYASSLPGRRLGPELLKVIHHNFFPRSGQNDPETIRRFRERRREAAVRMAQAANGQPVDLESLISPLLRRELDRVAPREDGTESVGGVIAPTNPVPNVPAPRRAPRVILR